MSLRSARPQAFRSAYGSGIILSSARQFDRDVRSGLQAFWDTRRGLGNSLTLCGVAFFGAKLLQNLPDEDGQEYHGDQGRREHGASTACKGAELLVTDVGGQGSGSSCR